MQVYNKIFFMDLGVSLREPSKGKIRLLMQFQNKLNFNVIKKSYFQKILRTWFYETGIHLQGLGLDSIMIGRMSKCRKLKRTKEHGQRLKRSIGQKAETNREIQSTPDYIHFYQNLDKIEFQHITVNDNLFLVQQVTINSNYLFI